MAAALILAGLLVLFGIGLFWREMVVARSLAATPVEDAEFLRRRTSRRLRIAVVICILGLLMAVGGSATPRERPLVFVSAWLGALLATLWLLWLAATDLFSVRLHWSERRRQNQADIAQAKSQLKAFHKSPEEQTTFRGGL
jgi:hypothetical protein